MKPTLARNMDIKFAGLLHYLKPIIFQVITKRVKKIFPIIIGLISLSLIGIIVIQVLWLKNMVLLRQEQIRHHIQDGVTLAGNDLIQHKANYNLDTKTFPSLVPGDYSLEYLRPNTIGQRLSVNQLTDIIKRSFHTYKLDNMKFEFGVATASGNGIMEKQSRNFVNVYNESSPKNYSVIYPLNSPSGSETENLSPNEILIVIASIIAAWFLNLYGCPLSQPLCLRCLL